MPLPGSVEKRQLQQPAGGSSGGFDQRGCVEECERRFPNRHKWLEHREGYDECSRACEVQSRRINQGEEETEETGGCPSESENNKGPHEGCECGSRFSVPSADFQCPPGYMIVQGAKGPSCRCIKWCEDYGLMPTCLGTGGGGGAGGEFRWSEDVDALIKRLMGQANFLLDVPRGLTDEERDAIYNRAFEKIRGGERPRIQTLEDRISRMGLLGSPFAEREVAKEGRLTSELLAGTARDIEIEEAQRRFNELMATTSMAQQLTAMGMSSEQAVEAINAARRGEGRESLNQLLAYFGTIYGGQNNAYWQAIMNQFGQQGGGAGGSIWDWIPYLPYLFGK